VRPQPRVLLLLDPRPGTVSPQELCLPDGRPLVEVVEHRCVAEAGEPAGVLDGKRDLAALLEQPQTPALQPISTMDSAETADICLVDAAALAFTTTYGDIVADPRPGPAVMRGNESDRAVAVRFDPADVADPGDVALVVRALGSAPAGGALNVLAGALTAIGHPPRELGAGSFPVQLVSGPGDLDRALEVESGLDEAALRLRRSSRGDDGFLSTFLVRPLSRRLTRRAVRVGVTPAAITGVSFLLGLLAAGAYAGGSLPWRLVGSLLLLVSLVVDCVDGEVARYTRTSSPRGGWLDVASDRTKEYAVYAGLAFGLAAGAAEHRGWRLASATFVVLLVRHVVDFGYFVRSIDPPAGAPDGAASVVGAWSERTNRRSALMWAKRAVAMPVGERTLLLVVLAPAVGARWCLYVLLVLSLVSAVYTTAGRVGRRAFARGASAPSARGSQVTTGLRLRTLVDAGPLASWLPGLSGRWGWLAPALARTVEQGGLLLVVAVHCRSALPAAYSLLVVVALHQYDVVYRQRLAGAVEDDGLLGRPGFVVRCVVVLLVVLLPLGAARQPVLWALAAVLAALTVVDSGRWWRAPGLGPLPRGRWLPGVSRAEQLAETAAPEGND
jgi:phosphatidylglycerophosphate synthase